MKPHLLRFLIWGLTMTIPLSAQTSAVSNTAPAHVRNSFDLTVHAPYRVAAPLFGPNGERAWVGEHWDPQFVYPQPAQDTKGAVFTIRHGSRTAVWVNTVFDLTARHLQYVYVVPDLLVTTIDVTFPVSGSSATTTRVHVVYERTALSREANSDVMALAESDRRAGEHWEKAIETSLHSIRAAPPAANP